MMDTVLGNGSFGSLRQHELCHKHKLHFCFSHLNIQISVPFPFHFHGHLYRGTDFCPELKATDCTLCQSNSLFQCTHSCCVENELDWLQTRQTANWSVVQMFELREPHLTGSELRLKSPIWWNKDNGWKSFHLSFGGEREVKYPPVKLRHEPSCDWRIRLLEAVTEV